MKLREKIESGRFVVTAELGPPKSCNGSVIRKKTAHFRKGISAVNITDNQTAIVRLSSIASAKIVLEEGLEPIIQITCRDRNRIAIQSDLLGAAVDKHIADGHTIDYLGREHSNAKKKFLHSNV